MCAYLLILLGILLSTGCTTLNGPANPDDPLESYNRSMFKFNRTLDQYAFKPVAEGYNYIMPNFANKGVSNFFSNIDDIVVFVNNILQFKIAAATETSARFVFNTTFGLLGFIDVSTPMGLPKHNEDFGQTLAVWGVGRGPYMILPVIGPSTPRYIAGLGMDLTYFDPIFKNQKGEQSAITYSIKFINLRAGLLAATNIIDQTAPDVYAFERDAWLARRRYLIYDGNPPDDIFSDKELFNDDLN